MTSVAMMKATVTTFNPGVLFDGTVFRLGLDKRDFFIMLAGMAVWLAVSVMQEKRMGVRDWLARRNIVVRWAVYLTCIFALMLLTTGQDIVGGFIYAQF